MILIMTCINCPYIREEFDERIKRLDEVCGHIEYDEADYDHADYCYCDKVNGKPTIMGRCSDAERITKEEWDIYREEHGLPPIEVSEESQDEIDNIPQETKMQKKRRRREEYNQHLKKLSERPHRTFLGAYPADKNKKYDEENPVRYIRCYNPRRARWIKKYCNRKVRRTKGVASRKGYRKVSDYDWLLW